MRKLTVLQTSLAALLAAWLATSVVGQKMPDPSDNRRVVQMHDASQWLSLAVEQYAPEKRGTVKAKALAEMAEFARQFIEPRLAPGSDIVGMSERYLVAIAEPQQQVWIEQLLARHMESKLYQVKLRLRQFVMSKAKFEAMVEPLLTKAPAKVTAAADAPAHWVLSKEHAKRFARKLVSEDGVALLRACTSITPAMATANEKLGRELTYLKDFEIEVTNTDFTATPIHSSVFDGVRYTASSGLLADGQIGVGLDLTCQKVEQPFATFETELAKDRLVSIDLPAIESFRWRRNMRLPDGSAALCWKVLGDQHCVFLLTVGQLE